MAQDAKIKFKSRTCFVFKFGAHICIAGSFKSPNPFGKQLLGYSWNYGNFSYLNFCHLTQQSISSS